MIRRTPIETKINHERWLVSYSDFITLLFAFFVVMYSVSQVSESKYKVLSDTLQSAFKSASTPSTEAAQPGGQLASVEFLQQQLSAALQNLLISGQVSLWGNEDWVEIEVNANLLFSSGSARPSREAETIFNQVAEVLSPYENAVAVSGHTDNVPINNEDFRNNWELSSARAVAVVNLLAYAGVYPERLSATGYGEYQPLADNQTEEGRARNRRVVLRVARTRAEASRLGAEAVMAESGERLPAYPAVPEQTQNTVAAPVLQTQLRENAPIKPIKLQNGGLLFTSDPDLPRPNQD